MNEKGNGIYDYKGFTIWSPGNKVWLAEPNWCIEAIENYKEYTEEFTTIAQTKKWIREKGINLKEEDYL